MKDELSPDIATPSMVELLNDVKFDLRRSDPGVSAAGLDQLADGRRFRILAVVDDWQTPPASVRRGN